jgi:hypothetical protein
MPSQGLNQWLMAEDAARLRGRVKRLRFLIRQCGSTEGRQLFHGLLSWRFFEEARWCFVNGQFIACVLLSQCFLEKSLRSLLAVGGQNYGVSDKWLEDAGFHELIEKAREKGVLTSGQARDCHIVRRMRVAFVHARPVFSKRHVAHRMITERKSITELSEQDAVKALKIMLRINRSIRERV